MLSLQGRIYVLACHALHNAIDLFDDLTQHHQGLATLVAEQAPNWPPLAATAARWAADELEFVYPHEDVGGEEVIALGVLAHTVNSELFVAAYNEIINAARRLRAVGGDGPAVHSCYVVWLCKILGRFDAMMHEDAMPTTAYHARYQETGKALLDDLGATLAATLDTDARHGFEAGAEQLATQWRARIRVAAQDFESPS